MTTLAAPFAELEADLAEACIQVFANVIVTRVGHPPFQAIKDVHIDETFDGRAMGQSVSIKYLATLTPPLQPNEIVTISGQQWRVMSNPAGDEHVLFVLIKPEP